MSQAHPALSSTAFPYPLHRPFLYRPFVPDSSQNDPFEDDDDASFSSASGYTCSLHPSGMSTNATMSDIVGPGRILDKYVYQRGGRLLERAIFRVSYKMMIRRLEDAIGEDFYSALWRASCSDETTGLAGLLHVWGVQDIPGWDEGRVLRNWKLLVLHARNHSAAVQFVAMKSICRLVMKYPRLRLYLDKFDLASIQDKLTAFKSESKTEYPWEFVQLAVLIEHGEILDLLLYRFSHRGSKSEACRCKVNDRALLKDLARAGRPISSRYASTDAWYRFEFLVRELLRIRELYSCESETFRDDAPIVQFWKKCNEILPKSDSPMLSIAYALQNGLIETWEGFSFSQQKPGMEEDAVADFVRLSFKVFCNLCEADRRLCGTGFFWLVQDDRRRLSELQSTMRSRTGLEQNRINVLWEECVQSFDLPPWTVCSSYPQLVASMSRPYMFATHGQ